MHCVFILTFQLKLNFLKFTLRCFMNITTDTALLTYLLLKADMESKCGCKNSLTLKLELVNPFLHSISLVINLIKPICPASRQQQQNFKWYIVHKLQELMQKQVSLWCKQHSFCPYCNLLKILAVMQTPQALL